MLLRYSPSGLVCHVIIGAVLPCLPYVLLQAVPSLRDAIYLIADRVVIIALDWPTAVQRDGCCRYAATARGTLAVACFGVPFARSLRPCSSAPGSGLTTAQQKLVEHHPETHIRSQIAVD